MEADMVKGMNWERAANRDRDRKQPKLSENSLSYLKKHTKPRLSDRPIGLPGKVDAETEKAYLFSYNKEQDWIPKRYCKWEDGVMVLPYWIAVSKKFIKEYGDRPGNP
jgi:hypothetical protein